MSNYQAKISGRTPHPLMRGGTLQITPRAQVLHAQRVQMTTALPRLADLGVAFVPPKLFRPTSEISRQTLSGPEREIMGEKREATTFTLSESEGDEIVNPHGSADQKQKPANVDVSFLDFKPRHRAYFDSDEDVVLDPLSHEAAFKELFGELELLGLVPKSRRTEFFAAFEDHASALANEGCLVPHSYALMAEAIIAPLILVCAANPVVAIAAMTVLIHVVGIPIGSAIFVSDYSAYLAFAHEIQQHLAKLKTDPFLVFADLLGPSPFTHELACALLEDERFLTLLSQQFQAYAASPFTPADQKAVVAFHDRVHRQVEALTSKILQLAKSGSDENEIQISQILNGFKVLLTFAQLKTDDLQRMRSVLQQFDATVAVGEVLELITQFEDARHSATELNKIKRRSEKGGVTE